MDAGPDKGAETKKGPAFFVISNLKLGANHHGPVTPSGTTCSRQHQHGVVAAAAALQTSSWVLPSCVHPAYSVQVSHGLG